MEIYKREKYLSKIRPFYDDDNMIKVIVGVRRCGKSCIMQAVSDEIVQNGVDERNVIYLDLDSKQFRNVDTPEKLENIIDDRAVGVPGKKYLFIDEVQNVENFEPLINAYRNEGGWSIFVTGSNAYLLSGELATKLTGRYIEFEVFTLDFKEYLEMKEMFKVDIDRNIDNEFATYIQLGGFPGSVCYETDEQKRLYIESVVQEIFTKDIQSRVKIKHVSVFNMLRDYVINNFGATTSITNLLNFFNNQLKVPIKRETVNRYIQVLLDAKIIYKCQRFDMKSRRSLQREEKYYIADLGFYFVLNTDNRINFGPELENVTYLYARSKGYSASIGRIGNLECDFVLRKDFNNYAYVQVSRTIADRRTEDREYASLEKIKDNYPKHLLTMDRLLQKRNGILHENLVDFFLDEKEFC